MQSSRHGEISRPLIRDGTHLATALRFRRNTAPTYNASRDKTRPQLNARRPSRSTRGENMFHRLAIAGVGPTTVIAASLIAVTAFLVDTTASSTTARIARSIPARAAVAGASLIPRITGVRPISRLSHQPL